MMGGKRKRAGDPKIVWRNGRAYGDFRAYADVGGDREALAPPAKSWGTKDEDEAAILFQHRLAELQAKRAGRTGTAKRHTTLAKLVRDHLIAKGRLTGDDAVSDSHMKDLEQRLGMAIDQFGAGRDPRTIEPEDVRGWMDELGADGTRGPGTIRHYLMALSGAYRRAQERLEVDPGYNPVGALVEKPSVARKREAAFLEVADVALLLEAARIVEERDELPLGAEGHRTRATPGLHAIVATFLLTGGRASEVLGLDVEDVSFDRGIIRFRPNDHRGLKTSTSHREVPLWPQLREILQEHLFGGEQPRTSGLLFPAPHGGMVGDLRKSLDAIGKLAGFNEGEVRTRRFRHTYCSARLQTVQRILNPGKEPTEPDAFSYVEVSKFQVQKEMGHGGAQLVDRIYGHAQRDPYRSEVVEYRVEKHRETLGERLQALVARL